MGSIVPLPVSIKLVCSNCGADGEGSCRCGAPYVPAKQRVAEYDKAKPGRSTRQAAADLGLSHTGVIKARKAGGNQFPPGTKAGVTQVTPGTKAGDNQLSPTKVVGRDGKNYPSSKQKPKATDGSMRADVNAFLKHLSTWHGEAKELTDHFKRLMKKHGVEIQGGDRSYITEAKEALIQNIYTGGEILAGLIKHLDDE